MVSDHFLPQMLLTEGAAPQGIVIHQARRSALRPPPAKPAKINYRTEGAHQGQANQRPIAQSPSVKYHSETNQAPRTQLPPNQALMRHAPATQTPPGPANQLQITGPSATPESNEEKRLGLKLDVEKKKIRKESVEDEIKVADARAAEQKPIEGEENKREAKVREQKAQREETEKEVRKQIRVNEVEAACEEDIQKEKEATDEQRRKNKKEAQARKDKQKREAEDCDRKEKQLEEGEESVLNLERERDDRKRGLERKKEQREKESMRSGGVRGERTVITRNLIKNASRDINAHRARYQVATSIPVNDASQTEPTMIDLHLPLLPVHILS
jgi:hypothetical protein